MEPTRDRAGRDVALFFLLAMAVTWAAVGLPALLPAVPAGLAALLATYGPAIVAIALLALSRDWSGLRRLFRGILRWRVGWRWYLVACSPLAVSLVAAALFFLGGGRSTPSDPALPAFTLPAVLLSFVALIPQGPLGQEVAWRGFALPRLQAWFSALGAALVLGLVCAAWTMPLWFLAPAAAAMPFWRVALHTVAMSILLTWAYNNTGGSLLIAVLFHLFSSFGPAFALLFLRVPEAYQNAELVIYLAYALAVVVRAGPIRLGPQLETTLPAAAALPAGVSQ